MADEFQGGICSGNWWDSARNSSSNGACSVSVNDIGISFGWQTEMVDIIKSRSCEESASVCDNSSIVFQDIQKPQLNDSTLQMMGFDLSSSASSTTTATDWNQALLRGSARPEGSYNSMLQQDQISSKNFCGSAENSPMNNFKEINQEYSLKSENSGLLIGSTSYGYPTTLIQSLFEPDPQPTQSLTDNCSMTYSTTSTYLTNPNELPSFLKPTSPKPQVCSQFHFSNNTPYWNASALALNDVRPSFLSPLQPHFLRPSFEEKPNFQRLSTKVTVEENHDFGPAIKKNNSEPAFKRARIETPSPLPTFKVRKEKLGDRITALQQLVSPFGKTDTASVLHDAIDYIKFLHDQVSVLSTPYMKTGASPHHQQNCDSSKDKEGTKQDLKGRGLCLVPISSTYPVANETTSDFWTPTFGGTFR